MAPILQLTYTHVPCVPATLKYLLKVHTKLFLSSQSVVIVRVPWPITLPPDGKGGPRKAPPAPHSSPLSAFTILYYFTINFCF